MEYYLDSYCEELVNNIPENSEEEFVFSAFSLPVPLEIIKTDKIIIEKASHGYNSWYQADMLRFQLDKRTCRQLGLLILSVIFHPFPTQVRLEITHHKSDIKYFIIEFDYEAAFNRFSGYNTHPHQFRYSPRETARYPWYTDAPNPLDLPCFWLTNRADMIVQEVEWNERDTILGLGNDEGSVRFAELLLNASCSQNKLKEYVLEGEAGFRGVGRLSAELSLFISED